MRFFKKPEAPIVLLFCLLWIIPLSASHLKSIQISVEKIPPCEGANFQVMVVFYINVNPSETDVKPGGGILDFGDGSSIILPELAPINRPDLGQFIGVAEFSTTHEYPTHGIFQISFTERSRNVGINNIANSSSIAYSTFTRINTSFQCNSFPELLVAPVDRSCSGSAFFHSPGAIDADGDSLHFEFVNPFQGINEPIPGFLSPIDPSFYQNFQQGSEGGLGPPDLSIDPATGLISWNAPGNIGEYLIAFKIEEWRTDTITGNAQLLSTTIRDMLVVVETCNNIRPDLIIPEDLCVVAGTVIDEEILGIDGDMDDVKIEFFSGVFTLTSPPTLSPSQVDFRPSPDTIRFYWETDCLHIRDQPYQVVVKITDNPQTGAPLVTFKTWLIKIIGPTPVWKDVSLDLLERKAIVEWEPYSCSNAEFIQIWRKVGPYDYTPGECDTGLPKYLGYELIDQVDPGDSIYIDNNSTRGLVDGALYCYRLVAVFPLPSGGKSYVTAELCVGPIRADAPVITNVTIEETDKTDGIIRVSWRSPFDIDPVLFPKPYRYLVFRGDGFTNENNLVQVADVVSDTTIVDGGINTQDSAFNYRIIVYSVAFGYSEYIPVDTSATASSVRLSGIPGDEEIELMWEAVVPWSNTIEGSPFHVVYRGGIDDTQLTLLTTVDVTQDGFSFVDTNVDPNSYYCYTIMTRGTYGNPKIDTLKNFSQRFCTYPVNDLVPCPPVLQVEQTNCDDFIQQSECIETFSNKINWTVSTQPGCRLDIVSYNLYATTSQDTTMQILQSNIGQTSFVDADLPSFARCYRITAVDSRGLESDRSEMVCNDNCILYVLPNVFTPSMLDGYNDTFRAYNGIPGQEETITNPCLYFIKSVHFSVVNRWGEVVFASSTQNGLPQTIEWNGKTSDGRQLESGIYFYKADVGFDVLDPTKKFKTIKGWVHLVR